MINDMTKALLEQFATELLDGQLISIFEFTEIMTFIDPSYALESEHEYLMEDDDDE